MKLKIYIFIVLFFIPVASSEIYPYVNPGLVIGKEFGKDGGFYTGIELSAGATQALETDPYLLCGLVGGIQYTYKSKIIKKYFEVQAGTVFMGVAYGREFHSTGKASSRYTGWLGAMYYAKLTYSPDVDIIAASLLMSIPMLAGLEVVDYGSSGGIPGGM